MYPSVYTIQLLNDLHNYFPDILYGSPDRFMNVSDLLNYIREVASISPYERGLHNYISNPRLNQSNPRLNQSNPRLNQSNPRLNRFEIIEDIPDRIFIPINRPNISEGSIITRILNGIINMDDLEDVVVQPTAEHILNATTVYHVNTLQDDICIICQDNIELNEVRRITHCGHYFHRNCIDIWFQTHVDCPTCRHDIRH